MYQSFFGLHSDPFALGPSLRFLYRSRAHAETMAHLGYGLEQGEDIILIVGAIGTGKTLALSSLQAKVSKAFHKVLVNVTAVTYQEFLKLVLHEMQQPWPAGADTADLLCLLKDRAMAIHDQGQKILLIVDEAQNLDVRTLEAIRLLTNIGQPDRQLFQVVLAGQPALELLIDRPELAQLRQRIRIHYRLEPLTETETGEYVAHRLAVAGRSDRVFTAAAVARIHELSRGVPRLVNHLASHALLSAYVAKDRKVDADHVGAEGLPEAPAPVVEATPPAVGEALPPAAAPPSSAPPSSDLPPAEEVPPAVTAAPPAPSRPLKMRHQPATTPARRTRSWAWVWLLVLLLAAAGAWTVLRDEPLRPRPTPQVGRLLPAPVHPRADEAPDLADHATETTTDAAPATLPVPADQPSEALVEAPAEQPPTAPPAGEVWLHVASFRDTIRAARYQQMLAATGYPITHRDVQLPDGRTWRRILIGPYQDAAQAESAAASLLQAGLITFHRVLAD